MQVRLWMTKKVITVKPSCSILELEQLLSHHNLRRIPVVESNKLIGIVSDTDIIKAKPSTLASFSDDPISEHASQLPVEQIMTNNPITVLPADPIEKAALKMRLHKISSIPVTKDRELVGIITETNIFDAFMEILGSGAKGARIELLIDHGKDSLLLMLTVFSKQGMSIQAITIFSAYSKEQQLVTVKAKGDNLDQLLDELWRNGLTVNQVLCDSLSE
jgi:acetoin utilization protein AcuB